MVKLLHSCTALAAAMLLLGATAEAQIGKRFPSERKVVPDPVTGVELTFLTSTPAGDSKIYQTHHQWTSDGQWLIFRSNRANGNAMAVNEKTGDMVQVTENGYSGMLCIATNSMNLYFLRNQRPPQPAPEAAAQQPPAAEAPAVAQQPPADGAPAEGGRRGAGRRGAGGGGGGRGGPRGPAQIIRVDLAKLFADSAAGTLKAATEYEHVCGTIPVEMGAGGDMCVDPNEDFAYFRVDRGFAAQHLPADTKPEEAYGPRGMGAGPTGLAKMDLKTGAVQFIVAVPFQIGHVQANPWMPGEILFCWETGGKAPQRMWTVKSDGTGLRKVFPEGEHDWITHEAVINRDEAIFGILAHRPVAKETTVAGPGQEVGWGPSGTAEYPTGLSIVNLRTREMRIIGQIPMGNPGRSVWHMHGSPDGRWAVADDFMYRLWIVDRKSGEMKMLADLGHKSSAQDHIHPTFSADGKKIQVQTAMLSEDGRSMNICVIPVPESWLNKTYTDTFK